MLRAHFNGIQKVIIDNISGAKSSVRIAVAWITNKEIVTVLEELHKKGVEIQLIVADDKINFEVAKALFQSMLSIGIPVRVSSFPRLMHNKYCIVDGRILVTGSYNWSLSAETNNYENVIETTDKQIIAQYIEAFSILTNCTRIISSVTDASNKTLASGDMEELELKLFKQKTKTTDHVDRKTIDLPSHIQELLIEADGYYFNAEYGKAIELCNEVLKKYPANPNAYEIIASCNWRQKKYPEQIRNASKAIELNNEFYSAYNLLGIGYSLIGNASKSIENYKVCINAEPENYIYYRNRALSYIDVEADFNVPKNFRDQSTAKANKDFKIVIELTDKAEVTDKSYNLYYQRGVAKFGIGKFQAAKEDFVESEKIYLKTPKNLKDIHHLREIKSYLKEIKAVQDLKR